jgi:hypothetical protein
MSGAPDRPPAADIEAKLVAVFRRLKLKDDVQKKIVITIEAAAAMLARMPGGAALPDPTPFREVAARRTRGDVRAVRRAAENLAANPNDEHARAGLLAAVGAMRGPAIMTLADEGFLRHAALDQPPERIIARAEAARARVKDRCPKRFFQHQHHADIIVKLLASWYLDWTGRNVATLTNRPGQQPSGVFFTLVADVFKILRIDSSVEAAIIRQRSRESTVK